MRTYKDILLLFFMFGFSLNSICQNNEPEDSLELKFESYKIEKYNISMDIVKNWRLIEDSQKGFILVQHVSGNSELQIFFNDVSSYKDSLTFKPLPDEVIKLDSLLKEKPNIWSKISLSSTHSDQVEDMESRIVYKLVGDRRIYIKSKNSIKYKEELDYMIESISFL